ncbi:MAG: LysM peptidoglycan-binding domain-containing protein [Clostridia bacterium]|jgi:LysM repeat protein|nr:LysM peptidoglycan-binding domain-containing protein [Clostridia bacterium]
MVKMYLINESENFELLFPVTPESYEIDHGINSETIRIDEIGDINLPGKRYMGDIKLDLLLPSKTYGFENDGTIYEPYYYIRLFEKWCDSKTILRFIISNTNVNTTCYIESIVFSASGGSGDLKAALTLKQYRVLKIISDSTVKTETGNNARKENDASAENTVSYTISEGDTLTAICRKYYGDTSLYSKLASYNNIANANLIYKGNTIKIPDKSVL